MIDIVTIRTLLDHPKNAGTNQVSADCPFCAKSGHFFISRTTLLWFCHKCQEKGNIYKLLKHLGRLDLIEGNQLDLQTLKSLGQFAYHEQQQTIDLPDSPLPAGFRKLNWNDNNIYARYLKSRKYTEHDFLFYQPGYTELFSKLEGYVIIPIYRNWSIKGYIARAIDPANAMRYQNKKGVKFNALLDGIDFCTSKTKNLILVEGHFDRVSVTTELDLHNNENFKAVASFGKKLSSLQLAMLCNTNVENLFLLYDMRDAVNAIKQFGNQLKRKINVFGCFANTEKDAGQMSYAELLMLLKNAQPIENYTYNILQFNALK